jgi:hypothetical protein
MRLLRLITTFARMPYPAYACAVVICWQMGYPIELADRVRGLIVWRRQRIFEIN